MENKQNIEQKKAWITPLLLNETVKETEGKTYNSYEAISLGVGPS